MYVSGPLYTVRLEGTIDGIEKVIYLFGDRHTEVENQTSCKQFDSITFNKFFYDNINNSPSNVTYDFFMETLLDSLNDIKYFNDPAFSHNLDIYIVNIRRMVYLIKKEKLLNNIRIHSSDIRNDNIINPMINTNNLANKINGYNFKNEYEECLKSLENCHKILKYIYDILIGKNIKNDNNIIDKHILLKLIKKFKHKTVKKEVLSFINKILPGINVFIKIVTDMIDIIKYMITNYEKCGVLENKYDFETKLIYFDNELNSECAKKINNFKKCAKKFDALSIWWISCITDIYAIKRILDKDYITNAILYGGCFHTNDMIYILMIHFNFKITHCSLYKNITQLNKNIIKNSSIQYINKIFYKPVLYVRLYNIIQCSNLTGFPKYFL